MELWNIITPAAATRFSREVPVQQDMILNRFLPDQVVNSFKPRIRTVTRTLSAAKFRAYNAENFIAKRPTTLTITDLELPPLGQKLPLLEREILEQALANNDPNGDVIAAVYDDIESNVRATRARMELARGDLLADGKITITENGLVALEADFGLASSHKPTAGTLWSNTTDSTPLSDEEAWIQQMVADGGGRPTAAITSLAVVNLLRQNAEYRAAYWGGNAGEKPALNPDQVNQVRATYNLPPITIYDTQIDVDGTSTRVLPVNRFVLVSDGVGETQWGLTAQALDVSASGADPAFTRRDAPGIFTAAYRQTEPAARWTSTYAVGLPLLVDKSRLVSAIVTS